MWETVIYLVGITSLKSNRGSPRKAEDALFFGPVVPLPVVYSREILHEQGGLYIVVHW